MSLGEFQLIDRYFRRAARRHDVVLGVGDDCALLRVPADCELAVSIDTLVENVHFPADADPEDIGHKSLAVGLSDLAAMGAEPAWATLSLSMPAVSEPWIQGFVAGFSKLAEEHDMALVGGDTVRGPLVISVQVHGHVPAGQALRRSGARSGDLVCVTGDLGGAALGLREWIDGQADRHAGAQARLHRPQPRIAAGLLLRSCATACIDVSDGVLADLGHILKASDCAAELQAERLPLHESLRNLPSEQALELALCGGDDYELLFCLPPRHASDLADWQAQAGCALSVIGRILPGTGLSLLDADGQALHVRGQGHDHFRHSADEENR